MHQRIGPTIIIIIIIIIIILFAQYYNSMYIYSQYQSNCTGV